MAFLSGTCLSFFFGCGFLGRSLVVRVDLYGIFVWICRVPSFLFHSQWKSTYTVAILLLHCFHLQKNCQSECLVRVTCTFCPMGVTVRDCLQIPLCHTHVGRGRVFCEVTGHYRILKPRNMNNNLGFNLGAEGYEHLRRDLSEDERKLVSKVDSICCSSASPSWMPGASSASSGRSKAWQFKSRHARSFLRLCGWNIWYIYVKCI